jgi:hypothetical protein
MGTDSFNEKLVLGRTRAISVRFNAVLTINGRDRIGVTS